MEFGIGVGGKGERRQAARLDIDAEFLGELANQRRLGRLSRLHLAAGKFPQPGEVLARRALGEQHAAVDVDQHDRRDQDDRERRPLPSLPRLRGRVRVGVSFDSCR